MKWNKNTWEKIVTNTRTAAIGPDGTIYHVDLEGNIIKFYKKIGSSGK
jgi:hypothetical protein